MSRLTLTAAALLAGYLLARTHDLILDVTLDVYDDPDDEEAPACP